MQIVIVVPYYNMVGYVRGYPQTESLGFVCNYCAVRLHNLSVLQYILFSQPVCNKFAHLKPECLLAKIVCTDLDFGLTIKTIKTDK